VENYVPPLKVAKFKINGVDQSKKLGDNKYI